jgi:hypothetical protein
MLGETIARARTPVLDQEHQIRVRRRGSYKPNATLFQRIAELP